jgi:hypothetical protein
MLLRLFTGKSAIVAMISQQPCGAVLDSGGGRVTPTGSEKRAR